MYEVNGWPLRKNNGWSWLIHTIIKMCRNVCVRTICGRCVNNFRLYYGNNSYLDPISLWDRVCIKYLIENRSKAPNKHKELNKYNIPTTKKTALMFFFVGAKMGESGQLSAKLDSEAFWTGFNVTCNVQTAVHISVRCMTLAHLLLASVNWGF